MKNRKKLKNKIIIILIVALFLHIIMPLSTLAQNEATISNIEEVFEEIEEVEENFDYNEEQEELEEETDSYIEESESNIEEVSLETKEATTSNTNDNYKKNENMIEGFDVEDEEFENIEEPEEQENNFYIKESTPSDVEENEILLYEQVATLSDIKETTPSNAEDIIENINVEDLAKMWSVDGITSYYFDIDGSGAMILPRHKYSFKYNIEKNKLSLNFDDNNIKETMFKVLINNDELILEREEETGISKIILKKVNN